MSFVTANDVEQGGRAPASEAGIEIAMVQAPAEAGTSRAWLGASSAPPLITVHSSIFNTRAEEEARRAAEAKTEADAAAEEARQAAEEARQAAEAKTAADAAAEAPKVAKTEAGAADGADGADTQGPQSLRAFLAACGLEHRAQNFEDEEYTLENLLSAWKSDEAVAKGDLRELKLTLGECRKVLNQLGATAT